MESFSEFINQRVAVLFDDGIDVKRREGILKKADSNGINLIDWKTNEPTYIPMQRIVRIERIKQQGGVE